MENSPMSREKPDFFKKSQKKWQNPLTKGKRSSILAKPFEEGRETAAEPGGNSAKKSEKLLKKGLTKREGCGILIRLSQRAEATLWRGAP